MVLPGSRVLAFARRDSVQSALCGGDRTGASSVAVCTALCGASAVRRCSVRAVNSSVMRAAQGMIRADKCVLTGCVMSVN